ncbi:MAG: hypothetical protein N2035_01765 [Chthoniobacterales bacterium]|nr:hypothetical protein [Chthoniobacterales bacterium]
MRTPDTIQITVTVEWLTDDYVESHSEPVKMSLAEKLNDYLIKLGYSNDHVMGVVLRLLTHGKVKVEFREYRERLELCDPRDLMARPQIIEMFDRYLQQLNPEAQQEQAAMTQRIVVQPKRK